MSRLASLVIALVLLLIAFATYFGGLISLPA